MPSSRLSVIGAIKGHHCLLSQIIKRGHATTTSSSASTSNASNKTDHSTRSPQPKGYWDALAVDQKNPIPRIPQAAYRRYTASDLARLTHPPRCAGMLVRDFIEDSLYNPNYGYFSKKALIFSPNVCLLAQTMVSFGFAHP